MIKNLEELVSDGLHLVYFSASWCGPCKKMSKIIDEINNIDVIKIDTEKNSKLVFKYKIMSVPTMIIFKNGKKLLEISGIKTKEELEEIISKYED